MANLTPYQLDALNYDQHISLTANAGSGKTFVLARRFLAILLEKNVALNNVVAITFTEKAAAELYKKIADELDSKILESSDEEVGRKLERIRRQLVSAKISTIHSFCADLLKEFSPEAGIDANFIAIDNRLSNELITTTVEELISELMRNEGELISDLKSIIRLFGSRLIVSRQLKSLIAQRSIVKKLFEETYNQNITEISAHFNEIFSHYFKKIFGDEYASVINQIKQINTVILQSTKNIQLAEEVKDLLNKNIPDDLFQKIIWLNQILKLILTGGKVRTRNYLSKDLREKFNTETDEIERFAAEFSVFDFNGNFQEHERQLARFGVSILNLWKELLSRYEKKKRQLRYMDFEDLLLVTQDLLKRKDVIDFLADRYQYFMIDEYQDTNETQYNIFVPILDYLKRGNLFIVGDEKQSIYMFRGADLEIFSKTKSEIEAASDTNSLLKLPHSFRLSPKLTLFANELFSSVFDRPNIIFNEVEYNELICATQDPSISEIEFLISEMKLESDSESELIAKKIIQITQSGNFEYKDIAILSRKRKSFAEIEKAFIEYQIPYLIFGGKGFFQRQEIYDLFNYLSFLINPNNDAALIGILRSPFFSISDTELFELSLESEERYFSRLRSISARTNKMAEVYVQLNKHIQLAKTLQISLLIRKILMDTGYWVVLSAKNNSRQFISNIEKLITTANDFSSQGLRTLYDFVNYLEDAINRTEDESQASLMSSDNAVKLMTIHASKGLEYPVVFLIDSNSQGMDDKVKTKGLSIDKNFGILTKTPNNDDYFGKYQSAPIVCLYNYIIQKKSIAELKRLLYVGVTRAEKCLYITAEIKRNKDGLFNPKQGSFLSFLKQGLKIDDFIGTLSINGIVNFMLEENRQFFNSATNISISVPITNQIEKSPVNNEYQAITTPNNFQILTHPIPDLTKNEIISATKVAVFNQCPFKYYLIYELGYSALHSNLDDVAVDFSKENNNELSANFKGSIIHKILEERTPLRLMRVRVSELMNSFNEGSNPEQNFATIDSIYRLLDNYYCSEIFQKLERYENYKNEFEIYAKQSDFFIYGIIDKVVFYGDRIFIYDYKTDNLSKSSPQEKLENYRAQLTFYALLISKLFENVKRIECSLIFIENPNVIPTFTIDAGALKNFEKDLNEIVNSIRHGIFKTKTSHCKSCYFSDSKNECVVKH